MEPQSGGFNSRTKRPARLEPRRTPCRSGERRGCEDTRAPCAGGGRLAVGPDGKTSAGHRQAFVVASPPPRGRLLNLISDEQQWSQLQWESNVSHVAAD
ncbi:unnamed protein product [Boreogadus saida]